MAKIYLQTHGCSANISESDIMRGLLHEAGHQVTDNFKELENSDISIINICTVKGDYHALKEIRKLRNRAEKLIVTGCIPSASVPKIKQFSPISLVSTHNIKQISLAVSKALSGEYSEHLEKNNELKINLPKKRLNPIVNIVPIASGCNSACSFCSVKLIKGNILSYPMEKIIEDIKTGIKEGCKEVWITSQDNSAYGLDTSKTTLLPDLIESITKVQGDFKIRIGMMSPQHLFKVQKEFIEAIKSEKVFKFLHIPLQSGSDEVLKRMLRHYSIKEYKDLITNIRREFPEITLATDMIVGFPWESDEDFKKSLDLMHEIKFDIVNISRYAPREGTVANKWKPITGDISKKRSTEMTKVADQISLELNKRWLNWEGEIIVDEEGKDESWVGRNYAYKPIVVKTIKNLLGRTVRVKVNKIESHYLIGCMV